MAHKAKSWLSGLGMRPLCLSRRLRDLARPAGQATARGAAFCPVALLSPALAQRLRGAACTGGVRGMGVPFWGFEPKTTHRTRREKTTGFLMSKMVNNKGRFCPICGALVVRRGSRGPLPTYCGPECKLRANRPLAPRRLRYCVGCGEPFLTTCTRRRWCGHICYDRHRPER
jgi:hypothetical protein